MQKLLNALILDDSQSDALLLLHALKRGGFTVNHVLVDNAKDLQAALSRRTWDIILSDYSMPSFDAPDALKIVRDQGLDIPFIVVSGTVGEDAAVIVMKAGANDFFAKNNLARIVPTVERELREAVGRRRRNEAEARFEKIFHSSPVGIVISRLSDGVVLDVNPRFLEDYGFSRDQLIGNVGNGLETRIKPEHRKYVSQLLQESGSAQSLELEYQDKSGETGFVLFSAEIIEIDNESCVLSMVQDITARKHAEETLRISEEKFRLLAENSTDMISRQTPDGKYIYVSPACQLLLGYAPEELVGRSAYEFYHSDDIAIVTNLHQVVVTQDDISPFVYRIRRKDGIYIWFETTTRTIQDPETKVVLEIHSTSRDITVRKNAEDTNRIYAERLELLHNIDMAILKGQSVHTTATSILSRLQTLIGFDSASISAFDAGFREFTTLAAIAPTVGSFSPDEEKFLIELINPVETYLVNDLAKSKRLLSSEERLLHADFRAYVCIPLIVSGNLVGSLSLYSKQPEAFSSVKIAIAEEVGAQLAIAIEKERLIRIERRRTNELSALHGASLQLTSSLDVKHVLNTILDYAIALIQADDAHIFLYDGEKLTFGTASWEGEKRTTPIAEPRKEGLTYTIARSGERIIIPDVNFHPIYRDWQWGGAIIGLPLHIGNLVVGVMSLSYLSPREFDEQEIRVLELLADQAAIAIHNAQLYEQIHDHATELERRVQERTSELYASETKYRSLIEFAPDPIIIVNANGLITLANKRAEQSFGFEQQELMGQTIEILFPNQRPDLYGINRTADLVTSTQRAMESNLDFIARHKDGKEIPVKIGLSPIDTGIETLVMAYIVDVTADKELEASLRTALAKEQELNELRTSFTSIVSHEFRTPLSVIMSSTDLLRVYGERMDLTRRQEKLSTITSQVKRLIQLLDDVLQITRSETTGFVYKPTLLNLIALSEELLMEIRTGYRQNVTIEFTSEGGCDPILADEFLFSHILQNLASNAVKYSAEGGTVQVHLTCSPSSLILRVQDQGIGIPDEDQRRLFEAFQRASNVGQIQGTGIGLTIVKRAVDACGGTIEVESTEGKGTTFIVTLPII